MCISVSLFFARTHTHAHIGAGYTHWVFDDYISKIESIGKPQPKIAKEILHESEFGVCVYVCVGVSERVEPSCRFSIVKIVFIVFDNVLSVFSRD